MEHDEMKNIKAFDKHQDRGHYPRLIASILMMLLGVLAIVVLMFTSAPRPG